MINDGYLKITIDSDDEFFIQIPIDEFDLLTSVQLLCESIKKLHPGFFVEARYVSISRITNKGIVSQSMDVELPTDISIKTVARVFRRASFKNCLKAIVEEWSAEKISDKDLEFKFECDMDDVYEEGSLIDLNELIDNALCSDGDVEAILKVGYLKYSKKLARTVKSPDILVNTVNEIAMGLADEILSFIGQFDYDDTEQEDLIKKCLKAKRALLKELKNSTDSKVTIDDFEQRNGKNNIHHYQLSDDKPHCDWLFPLIDVDQSERFGRAMQTKPISINKEQQSGTFCGSEGDTYITTLKSCSCMDYWKRKRVCKHMYRLAFDLNLINSGGNVLESNQNMQSTDYTKTSSKGAIIIDGKDKLKACLILGIIGVLTIPIFIGGIIGFAGLILGIIGKKQQEQLGIPLTVGNRFGLVLCVICTICMLFAFFTLFNF